MERRLRGIVGFDKTPRELPGLLLAEAGKTMTVEEFADMLVRKISELDTPDAMKRLLFTMTDNFTDAMFDGEDARSHAKLEIADRLGRI
jgi:hypothetical protein